MTGSTFSTDFPTTSGVFQTSNNDASGTAFVTELNSTGTALNYSTYLGGSGDANGNGDAGAGIAVDSSNNTYVTGQTYSTDFPTTPGAFQTSNNDASGSAFVTELNSTGTALNYSTYLGGSGGLCGGDAGYGIAVHSSSITYVTGQTCSIDFPTTAGAFDTVNNGAPKNIFVNGTSVAFVTELITGATATATATQTATATATATPTDTATATATATETPTGPPRQPRPRQTLRRPLQPRRLPQPRLRLKPQLKLQPQRRPRPSRQLQRLQTLQRPLQLRLQPLLQRQP